MEIMFGLSRRTERLRRRKQMRSNHVVTVDSVGADVVALDVEYLPLIAGIPRILVPVVTNLQEKDPKEVVPEEPKAVVVVVEEEDVEEHEFSTTVRAVTFWTRPLRRRTRI